MPDPRTPPRKRHRSKGPGSPRPPALRKPVQGERERGRPKERSVKVDPVPTKIPDKKQKVKKEKKEKDKKEEKSDKKREGSKKRVAAEAQEAQEKEVAKLKEVQEKAGEKKEAKGEGKREKRDKKGKKEKKDKKDKKEKKKGTKKNVKKESKKRRSDEKSDAKRIKYVPCVKEKIEHIFDDKGDSRADEGCSEATTRSSSRVRSTTSMSSKEKAEQKLRELTAIMGDSDHDESEEVTDEEELLAMGDEVNAEGAEEEDSDEGEADSETEEEEAEEMGSEEEEDKEEDEGNSSEESGDEAEDDDEGETSGESEEEKDDNKEEKEREQEEKKKLEHALVPVVKTSQESVQVMRNSMTNKKEWDTFTRQAKTKMPIALNDTYQASKTELFNMWLDSNYSWSACALAVERKHQESNTAKKGWKAIQGKELKNRYTAEKWEQVKKKRLEQGLYYKDDDFPDDDDETRQHQAPNQLRGGVVRKHWMNKTRSITPMLSVWCLSIQCSSHYQIASSPFAPLRS